MIWPCIDSISAPMVATEACKAAFTPSSLSTSGDDDWNEGGGCSNADPRAVLRS